MSSWHFLLIVMATDSMVFHWIWTGINVGNQLWVTMNSIFYPRPVFYLIWLHLSLWLLLLPAHDHCVISASHGSACTRENGILHQDRPFLHPHTMSFLRTTPHNRHSPYVTFNTIRSVNITTMKQDLWILCDCMGFQSEGSPKPNTFHWNAHISVITSSMIVSLCCSYKEGRLLL